MARKNNDIDDLLIQLGKDVTKIVDSKVKDEVKEVYREEVDYAYDEFEPTSHIRRYNNNGFGDENNWEVDIDLKGNDITLELTNEAKAVNSTIRLDKIIEEGIYDWSGNVPGERPVYQRTEERLKGEQVVENALESGLRKLGYKF